MDKLREDCARPIGVTPEGEVDLRISHLEKQSRQKRGRAPTEGEIEERRNMLMARGIPPIPDDARGRISHRERAASIPKPSSHSEAVRDYDLEPRSRTSRRNRVKNAHL